ncbi:MAG TPA: tetratricopeptide repeat protein [Chthoniobacterales bacterium]|jgi:Tfp pilus assembly protein PilF|nr:tetratricopeptide repeat protein [Chthoniobacterales bacterium]
MWHINPNYASPYKNRGVVKFMKGDLNGAMADYNQAIKLGSKSTNEVELPD